MTKEEQAWRNTVVEDFKNHQGRIRGLELQVALLCVLVPISLTISILVTYKVLGK